LKLGKSILLDELLKADDVQSTAVSQNRFWIVCPASNEAIFKVVRHHGTKDDSTLHNFFITKPAKLTRQTVNYESAE